MAVRKKAKSKSVLAKVKGKGDKRALQVAAPGPRPGVKVQASDRAKRLKTVCFPGYERETAVVLWDKQEFVLTPGSAVILNNQKALEMKVDNMQRTLRVLYGLVKQFAQTEKKWTYNPHKSAFMGAVRNEWSVFHSKALGKFTDDLAAALDPDNEGQPPIIFPVCQAASMYVCISGRLFVRM